MAELKPIGDIITKDASPFYKETKNPLVTVKAHDPLTFKLIYDSSAEGLEPVYFWIFDFLNGLKFKIEKLNDSFSSTPGGGHFTEFIQKAQSMQQASSKIGGDVNIVIKSVLNLIYDLKEFQLRLENYENANSEDKDKAEAGMISLKQIWMDQVDIKKGRGSINMMAQDLSFVTLRDAFIVAKNASDVENLDLNDRVKRVLKARIEEFLEWKERSYTELKKRFEIEKTYLKSQVASLKMYSQWAKPYLIAAQKLAMSDLGNTRPEMVTAFNTLLMNISLLGIKDIMSDQSSIDNAVANKELPKGFEKIKFKRHYYSCVLIDFFFRGIPARLPQGGYSYGGRVEVTFRAFGLNDDELKILKAKIDESDLTASFKLIDGMTDESIGQIKDDIEKFLGDNKEKEDKEKKKSEDVNPFLALFGIKTKSQAEKEAEEKEKKAKADKEKKDELKKLLKEGIAPDNYAEKVMRNLAINGAEKAAFTVYDIYKKGHGMASAPFGDAIIKNEEVSVDFKDIFS